jgi:transposase InsO family protein
MDFIGPITPASWGAIWILTATEYYTKWVEAIALRRAMGAAVANFTKENIVCHFGIPRRIISDNGTPFSNREVKQLLERYNVTHNTSTPYYPKGNGQAEVTNKRLLRILNKTVHDNGKNWKEELPIALWAHRTSRSTATGATPFSLVYGTEAILPVNVTVLAAKVADSCEPFKEDELEVLEERRTKAALRHSLYLSQMGGRYEHNVKKKKLR